MKLIYLSGKYVNIDTIRTISEESAGKYYTLTFINGDVMNINKGEYEMLVEKFCIKMKPTITKTAEERIREIADKENRLIQRLIEDGMVIITEKENNNG